MSSAVELIHSTSLSAIAHYSYAAITAPGARLIVLAGACPIDLAGSTVALGDYAGQASKAFENLLTALADAHGSLTDLLSVRMSVASSRQQDLLTVAEVVRIALGEHNVPSTLVGVTVLGYDGQLVEIEAIAATSADAGA